MAKYWHIAALTGHPKARWAAKLRCRSETESSPGLKGMAIPTEAASCPLINMTVPLTSPFRKSSLKRISTWRDI